MANVLVIDYERNERDMLKKGLEREGHKVDLAMDEIDGVRKLKHINCDFVVCEVRQPSVQNSGIARIRRDFPDIPVIMTSGMSNDRKLLERIKKEWSVGYMEKPIDLGRLLRSIESGMDCGTTQSAPSVAKYSKPVAVTRRRSSNGMFSVEDIIGGSDSIRKLLRTIEKVAPSEARVLITGRNGTGKELVAKLLHEKSSRRDKPFIEVNCAAIPSELIESELFGHEKGAFTSAHRTRKGKFEQADGGTIFLDEIGDMSLAAQAKVLRALQERRISPVGSDTDVIVDVRVIAATNKNLIEEIAKCNFREDLFHRLSVITLRVPPLSERLEDIPMLARSFIGKICGEYGIPAKSISPEAIEELKKLKWTGNVRQLHNVMERLIVLSEKTISLEDVMEYAYDNCFD